MSLETKNKRGLAQDLRVEKVSVMIYLGNFLNYTVHSSQGLPLMEM